MPIAGRDPAVTRPLNPRREYELQQPGWCQGYNRLVRLWLLLCVGCSSSTNDPSRPPERIRDVIIEAPDSIAVIYKDGDGDWQLAPQIRSRRGFDLASEHYAVAFVDPSTGSIETVYTTRSEQIDFVRSPAAPEPALHHASGTIAGLGGFGGAIAVGEREQTVFDVIDLDVPEGLHAITAGKHGKPTNGRFLTTLALRRDVLVRGPLELAFDLDAEALPVNAAQLQREDCQFRSTFFVGDTGVQLADLSVPIIAFPDRSQWHAGDRLDVRLVCRDGIFQTNTYYTPGHIPTRIAFGPTGAIDGRLTPVEDRWAFEWTPLGNDTGLQAVLGGAPCDTSQLFFEEYPACSQRWSMRMSSGWAELTSARAVAVISAAELDALGIWDPALELPRPLAWSFESRSESVDAVTRAVTVGTID